MASLKNILISHSPFLHVALPFWYLQNYLASGAKPGSLLPDLGFSKVYWVFLLNVKYI